MSLGCHCQRARDATLYGTGANGKSTFTGVLEYILGDYFQKAPRSLIQAKRSGDDGIPCDVARLQGARFVVCNELEEGRRIAESLVKDLTGGDRMVARFMRQDLFEFAPTHKLWLYGNHRPTITGTDEGIWRRIRLIPFTVSIPESARNPHLKDELLREAPGILNWLIDGCRLWQSEGLGAPQKVRDAVGEYREAMDTVGQFVEEVCVSDPVGWTASAALHRAYVDWATAEGIDGRHQLGPKSFANRLRDRGFRPEKNQTDGMRGWSGVRLQGVQ
jgi:putative DNA primase/helicase